MMERPSLHHNRILKCTAFRVGIGMPEAKFMMLNVPELGETRLLNASARCSDPRQNYTTSTPRIDENRACFTLSP